MSTTRGAGAVLVMIAAGVLAAAALGMAQDDQRVVRVEGPASGGSLPASMIIHIDGAALMLDTRTGAVFSFEGSPSSPDVRNRWRERVPAIEARTPGRLEPVLTRTGGEDLILLVDRDEGRTWVLKYRGSFLGSWEEILRGG